jgi:phosphoribosylformylglycinamidine synthase
MDLKAPGDLIYMIGQTFRELGGSEYYRLKGFLGRTVPRVRANQASRIFNAITKAIDQGLIRACHDLSEGGMAVGMAEMAFAGGYGVELDLKEVPSTNLNRDDFVLFSESNSRFLVGVSEKAKKPFEKLMKGTTIGVIGRATRSQRLCVRGLSGKVVVDVSVDDMMASWKQAFS